MSRENEAPSKSSKRDGVKGPRVIEITPEGRLIVDPMSIIGSESAKRHLREVAEIIAPKKDSGEPSPA